jgi:hypothetical protein
MMAQRIAFTARVRAGERERLAKQFEVGPPFDPDKAGFDEHAVFLGDEDVLFLFEGEDPLPAVRRLAAQPGLLGEVLKMAGTVSPPHMMREVYRWSRDDPPASSATG